jgi:PAS domain S-box-containing protein
MNEQVKRLAIVAIAMLIVAALHVGWFAPRFSTPVPAALLLLGVFASALYGGLWPGLLATAISVAAIFFSWRHAAMPAEAPVRIVLVGVVGILTALMAQATTRARLRADSDRAALRRQMQERVEAELRLASSEERFRTVVDTLPDLVFTADAAGRFHVLNGHWLDCSTSRRDVEPGDLFALVHPADVARARVTWDEAIAAGVPLDLRCRMRARDQTYRWVLARAQLSAAPNASDEHWFGVIIDIDKAVVAERALRDSDERLQLALAATGLGSFEVDFASGAQTFNESARSMLGFGTDATLTREVFEARIEPSDLEHTREAIARARTGGEGAQFDLEYRFQRPDSSWRWIAMRGKCFADPSAPDRPAVRCLGTLHDVTDRRDAEHALAEAAERLRLALEATDLGMWDYDFASDTAVCSDRIYAIAGLEPNSRINHAAWLALVLPDDVPMLIEHTCAAAAAGGPGAEADQQGRLDIEYRLRRASDGAIRWVALTGRVAFAGDHPPKPVRATGTLRDVTRRRESVEQLRHSEQRLALAQEAGRIGMFDWDLETNAVACSITEEALLGLAPGTFPGTDAAMLALIHPADQRTVEATLRIALDQQESYADEFRIVRPDGAVRWISAQASITRAPDGAPVRMIGVHRDVTDDKLAAQRLEESEERFRLAADALDGLIYDHDPGEDHVERSRGLYEVTGFDVRDVPATGAWWRSRMHPDDLARAQAAFDKAVANGALRIEQEYRVRHRDGHWVYVNDRALLVWRNGVVCRIVGVATDVSERRRIERVLHDADRRKDEFLAVLAHELRNPLAPIRNAVQVIARAPEPETLASAAAILERQVTQMVRLIDDLLDVSRIAQGKLKLRRKPTSLASIIEAAVETVQPLLRVKRQVFEQKVPAASVMIEADGVRLSQVLANLLHNAIKYTPPGGHISLAADVDSRRRMIELRVTDSGIGISPQALETIFTMFSQLPHDEEAAGNGSGRHDGLGIGLALARAVVSLHGGTIHAISEGADRGAQFVLRLPLSAGAKVPDPAPSARQEPAHWRVLVVDDNRDSAESLAAVLRLDQHQVFVAYGGREAILVAERERPDLILLDIGMPDIDGYEVARLLRAGEQTASTRIVALSGYGQAGDREKSFAAGCDGHLVKPVAPADLAAWLQPGAHA